MSAAFDRPLVREASVSAVVAAALAGVLLWLGPPGVDLAAHSYQRTFLLQHGFALWNNFWYAGRYSFVTYSFIYYPLAAVLGITVLAIASIGAAAGASRPRGRAGGGGGGPLPARGRAGGGGPPPPVEPRVRRSLDGNRPVG